MGGRQAEGRLKQHEEVSISPAEAGFEDRKRGHDPRIAGGFKKLGKIREWLFPLEPPEGMLPY